MCPSSATHTVAERVRAPGPSARMVIASATSMVMALLPVYLTGAMANFMEGDLRFSAAKLGLALSVFYVASTAATFGGGRLGDRLGARRALTAAVMTSAAVLVAVGILAHAWWQLAVLLAIGGVANAVAQPATNIAMTRLIPFARQGVAFGLKQTSAAATTFLAGAAVPVLAVTVGWRWAFEIAALLAVVFLVALPPRNVLAHRVNPPRAGTPHASTRTLLVLAGAVTLAVATASALATFFVSSAVAFGWSRSAAGLWLAAGSLCSILARVAWGWLADRHGARLQVVALLMLVGSLGVFGMGRPTSTAVLGVATLIAFTAGWGWSGVFQLAVIRQRERAPGAVSGFVLTGMFLGGVVGPPAFGFLAQHVSYAAAWTVAAANMALAGILLLLGASLVQPRTEALTGRARMASRRPFRKILSGERNH